MGCGRFDNNNNNMVNSSLSLLIREESACSPQHTRMMLAAGPTRGFDQLGFDHDSGNRAPSAAQLAQLVRLYPLCMVVRQVLCPSRCRSAHF